MDIIIGLFGEVVLTVVGFIIIRITFKEDVDKDIKMVKDKVKNTFVGLKYRKDLGKEYWKIVKYLEKYCDLGLDELNQSYIGQYRVNLENLNKVVQLYKGSPKEYHMLMDKYYPAISLSKHMLEEAKNSGIENDSIFNKKLSELIEEFKWEFDKKEKSLQESSKRVREQEIQVLGQQMEEEAKILRGVRKLKG